jgi:uncharacterized protein (DUF885 family)
MNLAQLDHDRNHHRHAGHTGSGPARAGGGCEIAGLFQKYLDEHFRQQPTDATRLGDHRFDGLLDDVSAAARERWLQFDRETLARLPQEVDYARLTRDGQIDFEIFQHELQTGIWLTENTHPFEEDPRTYGAYINDSVYQLLVQSTQPKETNIAHAWSGWRGFRA